MAGVHTIGVSQRVRRLRRASRVDVLLLGAPFDSAGCISAFLAEGVTPDVVSERVTVTLDVLYKHCDVGTEQEKMAVRKAVKEAEL